MLGQFHEMREHALETNQKPTHWLVGPNVIEEIFNNMERQLTFQGYKRENPQLFGIDIHRSADLPKGCVVLRCGKWTAGAFNIYSEAKK